MTEHEQPRHSMLPMRHDGRGPVGRGVPVRSAQEHLRGRATFTADIDLPGLLRGGFLRSPYPSARLVSIDTSLAERLPGVRAVLTWLNTPSTRYSDGMSASADVAGGDQRLFSERVRYVGEPVAAVAAEDAATLRTALDLIHVEYAQDQAIFDPLLALESDARRVHEELPDNVASRPVMQFGDVDAAFRNVEVAVEETFNTSRQKHVQLETSACVAAWQTDQQLTVWSPSQTPHPTRTKLAALFGLPESAVRVITPAIGGAFGAGMGFALEPHAAALAAASRRPVRLELGRAEMFLGAPARHAMTIKLRLGFQADGRLEALAARLVANTGAYATHGPAVVRAAASHFLRLYPCPNLVVEAVAVYTHTPPAGAFRGFGGPQVYFALEQCVDMAARRLSIDPIELRRMISIQPGAIEPTTRLPVVSNGLRACFDSGSAAIGWHRSSAQHPQSLGPRRRGFGMASVMWLSGIARVPTIVDESEAMVTLNPDGTATLTTAACDLGTGLHTALSQIVAEELQLPLERVVVDTGDTSRTPPDSGAHASRSLFMAGNAARLAASEARAQLISAAAAQLEVSPEDVVLANEGLSVRGVSSSRTSWAAIVEAAELRGQVVRGHGSAPQTNAAPFGAQFVEVEVDTETGRVTIVRFIAAHDVGRAINPRIVEGQLCGAVAQGLGFALLEDAPLDPESGTPLAGTLADYALPNSNCTPPVEVLLVEQPGSDGPFGAKSCGEMGLVPTAAAVANAIYDAVGVRLTELPMTSERVLRGLAGLG